MRPQGVMLCNDIDNIFVFSIYIAGKKRNIFRQQKPFFWSEIVLAEETWCCLMEVFIFNDKLSLFHSHL